jgi:hypothetical protein
MVQQELKSMDLGKLLDRTFRMTMQGIPRFLLLYLFYFLAVMVLAVIFLVVFFGVIFMNTGDISFNFFDDSTYENIDMNPASAIVFMAGAIIMMLGILVIYVLFTGMTYDLFIRQFLDIEWNIKSSIKYISKKFWTILLAGVLAYLLAIAGFFVFCVGFLFVAPILAIFMPVILYEERSAGNAISRSYELVKQSYWPVFGTVLLGLALYSAAATIMNVMSSGLSTLLTSTLSNMSNDTMTILMIMSTVLLLLVSSAFSIFTTAFSVSFTTVLFFNQKLKHENFGVELLTRSMINEHQAAITTEHQNNV